MKKETIDSIAKIIACALALSFLISVIHLTGICSAQNLTNETGQTYIKWIWGFSNATVYLNGEELINDSDIGYFILTDLNPNEIHAITVIDNDNLTSYTDIAKTKPRMMVGDTILILLIGLILLILGLKVPLFFFPAFALFTYGGIISIHATTETYAILPFFTLGILSLFILALKFMTK